MQQLTVPVIVIYGAFILLGGIMGYAKAKSKMSLIMGVVFGVAIIVAGVVAHEGITWGLPLAALLAAMLSVVFLNRFLKTKKWMPSGMLMIVSDVVTIFLVLRIFVKNI